MGTSLERAFAADPGDWRYCGTFGADAGAELPVEIYLRRDVPNTRVPLGLIMHVPDSDVAILLDGGFGKAKRFSSRDGDGKWRTFGKW